MTTTVAATPARINLTCYHGDSWSQSFRFLAGDQPLDLSGLTARAQARDSLGQTSDLAASILAEPGTIQIALPEGGLPADTYDYDLELEDPAGAISSWVRGKLRIERDVTR